MAGDGRDVALVLGAGGARGLAHIGAIEVLEQRGYRIVAIAGSSMGALVGGIHATGKLVAYRDWVVTLQRSHVLRLLDFAFGFPGLIKGERIISVLRELVGDHQIEDLPIRYTAVATDLAAQREVWLNRGPLFEAIRASIAIPAVFTPQCIDGREMVDGGLLAPVPIAATRQGPADLVIAVDVNARSARPLPSSRVQVEPTPAPVEVDAGAGTSLRARLSAWIDSFSDVPAPAEGSPVRTGVLDLMAGSLDAMQGQLARLQLALDPPDLLIKVPRDSAAVHEFWRAKELIELGRQAAEAALDSA